MHFQYMTYIDHTLTQEPLRRGSGNFGRPSLVIIMMDLVCLNHTPE